MRLDERTSSDSRAAVAPSGCCFHRHVLLLLLPYSNRLPFHPYRSVFKYKETAVAVAELRLSSQLPAANKGQH